MTTRTGKPVPESPPPRSTSASSCIPDEGRMGQTRSRIVEAAIHLFSRNGYYRTSMDEIATAAGVAKGTLYYNFSSKDHLFRTVIEEGMAFVRHSIEQEAAAKDDPATLLERIITRHVQMRLDYPELARIFLHELTNGLGPETRERIAVLRREYLEFLARLLDEGARLSFLIPLPGTLTAAGLLSLMDGICGHWVEEPAGLSREAVIALVTNLVMQGVSARTTPGGRS